MSNSAAEAAVFGALIAAAGGVLLEIIRSWTSRLKDLDGRVGESSKKMSEDYSRIFGERCKAGQTVDEKLLALKIILDVGSQGDGAKLAEMTAIKDCLVQNTPLLWPRRREELLGVLDKLVVGADLSSEQCKELLGKLSLEDVRKIPLSVPAEGEQRALVDLLSLDPSFVKESKKPFFIYRNTLASAGIIIMAGLLGTVWFALWARNSINETAARSAASAQQVTARLASEVRSARDSSNAQAERLRRLEHELGRTTERLRTAQGVLNAWRPSSGSDITGLNNRTTALERLMQNIRDAGVDAAVRDSSTSR